MQTLLALAAISAGALADGSPEVPAGQNFEASDAIAERLIASGDAKPFVAVPAGKAIKMRVLLDCDLGKANDVVKLSPEAAQEAQNGGKADSDPGAVAYAQSLADEAARRAAQQ